LGIGKVRFSDENLIQLLFETMLKDQQTSPAKLAYDRPSPKLLAFLKKHYGLKNYVP